MRFCLFFDRYGLKFITPNKWYRKLRYRKGYGVHSPFTYNLITKVIEEKTPYYVFDDIENFRKELLMPDNAMKTPTFRETQHRNYGALLFRLVNFFKSRTVLQIGSSTGVMSLYLALSLRNQCECYALEERIGLLDSVRAVAEKYSLKSLYFKEGDYAEILNQLKFRTASFDFIFINLQGNAAKTFKALQLIKPFVCSDTVMIIDGIARNKAMKALWKETKNSPDARLTIDLLALGIVFFDDKLHKQHYKNYFDYGEKQSLYEKRRRRFHLPGRRKKSLQVQPSN